MAKMSDAQVYALRLLRGDKLERQTVRHLTRVALLRKGYMRQVPGGFVITQDGRDALAMLDVDGAPAVEAKPTERATFRPADEITVTTGDSGPSVRLTPAYARHKPEASDAELLQLLTLLDGGAEITRRLYHQWKLTGRHSVPFPTNDEALARAASYAVLAGLAHAGLRSAEAGYVLTAEPVHLDTGNGQTKCGRSTAAPLGTEIRHRVTTDPSKVTHERCLTT